MPAAPTCPKCGSAVREGDKFCLTCGASLAPAPAADTTAAMPGIGGANPVTQAADAAPTCPKCGAPHAAGDLFCMMCGSPLATATPGNASSTVVSASVCPNCGAEYESGDVFCMMCGTRL
jgi:uncharacterized membrane protein YvbJ